MSVPYLRAEHLTAAAAADPTELAEAVRGLGQGRVLQSPHLDRVAGRGGTRPLSSDLLLRRCVHGESCAADGAELRARGWRQGCQRRWC